MTDTHTLAYDPQHGEFVGRHVGPTPNDVAAMLKTIGANSLEALIRQTIPLSILQDRPLDLGPALTEGEALQRVASVASRNRVFTSLIGQGYHGTILPGVIQRNVLENPAWYTAYTPYQPEISQGRMEALLNFQTMIADLSGLDIANASLLDEATAAAEAIAMARRVTDSKANAVFVDHDCHPQTISVVRTRAEPLGWPVIVGDPSSLDATTVFAALLQYPGSSGEVVDFRDVIAALHDAKALVAMAADPLALTLLTSPGDLGADIAVGSTQRLGVPMGFGGPHAAYIATRDAFKRSLPGRLVGVTVDSRGARAYRLALQTREQHIRRERATSNICTAQVLLAVVASMYGVYHGPAGLKRIAQRVHATACTLADGLRAAGWRIATRNFFDTITVDVGNRQRDVLRCAEAEGLNLRRFLCTAADGAGQLVGISCDETTTPEVVQAVWRAFDQADPVRQVVERTLPAAGRASQAPLRLRSA